MRTFASRHEDESGKRKRVSRKKNHRDNSHARNVVSRYSEEEISEMSEENHSRISAKHIDETGRAIFRSIQHRSGIHAKMEVSQPGDASEVQADEVADSFMRGDTEHSQKVLSQPTTEISRTSESDAMQTTNEFDSQLQSTKGGGQKLDDEIKTELEAHTGTDLSGVNIHTGPKADTLNAQVGALAFAHDQDIYFREGQFNPQSDEGRKLLAHEVAHTTQQTNGVQPKIHRQPASVFLVPARNPAGWGFQVTAEEDYPEGDPEKRALFQAIKLLYHVGESMALRLAGHWVWKDPFPGASMGSAYTVSMNNTTFIEGLNYLFNSEIVFEPETNAEETVTTVTDLSSEETDAAGVFFIQDKIGINFYVTNGLLKLLAAKTEAYTREEIISITEFARVASKLTMTETDYFFRWVNLKYPGTPIADVYANLNLENVKLHIEKLYEFAENKLEKLADVNLLGAYFREEDPQLTKRFAELEEKINGIDPALIEEYKNITGLQWQDITLIAIGGLAGWAVSKGIENEDLSKLDEKLKKEGYSVEDITKYMLMFREQAMRVAFEMLDINLKKVKDEYSRYEDIAEVNKLIKYVSDNYGKELGKIDKQRAKGIVKYVDTLSNTQYAACLALSLFDVDGAGPMIGQILLYSDNRGDMEDFLKDKSAQKVMEALAWMEWTKTLDAKQSGLLAVTGPREDLFVGMFTPPVGGAMAQAYINKIRKSNRDLDEAYKRDQDVELPMRTEGAKEFPILADISIDPRELFMKDVPSRQQHILHVLQEKIDNNFDLRDKLSDDNEKVWELDGVIEVAKSKFNIIDGTNENTLITDRVDDIATTNMWKSIGIAALGIVLGIAGIFTGGTTTVAGLVLLGLSTAVSVYDLIVTAQQYSFEESAADTAIGQAYELSSKQPDILSVVLAAVGVGLDLAEFISAAAKIGKTIAVGAGRVIEGTQAVDELVTRFSKISEDLELRKTLTATEDINEVNARIESELGEVYEFVTKSRIRGNPDKATFITDMMSRLERQQGSPEFDAFISRFPIPADVKPVVTPGFAAIFNSGPDGEETLAVLLRNFGGNPKLLTQFSVECILDPTFPSTLTRIRLLPNMTEELVTATYLGLYKGGRAGFSKLPGLLDILEVARYTDPNLTKAVLTESKLRALLPSYPDPLDLQVQWNSYHSTQGAQQRTFVQFVTDAETRRLGSIQKIGGRVPINAKEYAGRTFSFDLNKNQLKIKQLAKDYGVQPPTLQALRDAGVTNRGLSSKLDELDNLARNYPDGVKFNAQGFPDFSPHIVQDSRVLQNPVSFRTTGDRTADFKAADQAAGITEAQRRSNSWVWHHHEDMVTMQLLPKDVHDMVKHTGGIAVHKGVIDDGD